METLSSKTHLAIVQSLDASKQLAISVHQLGKLVEECSSLHGREVRPRALKRLAGCANSRVDILLGSALKRQDFLIRATQLSVSFQDKISDSFTHVGFRTWNLSPLPCTNSLLIKRPVGCSYLSPLGKLISMLLAILNVDLSKTDKYFDR